MEGMNIIGLYITGSPKMMGSFTPNRTGMIPSFPIAPICFERLLRASRARASVAPLPPIVMKYHTNGGVTTKGSAVAAVPAANASMLA